MCKNKLDPSAPKEIRSFLLPYLSVCRCKYAELLGKSRSKEVHRDSRGRQRVRSYFFALSNFSPFHFFCPGFLFKVLGNVTDSLLFRIAIRDVNEICRSRSRAKVREEGQNSAGQDISGIITPFTIWYLQEPITSSNSIVKHSFSPTSHTF